MEHRLPYSEFKRDAGDGPLDTQAMHIGVSEGATTEDNPSHSHCGIKRKSANDKNGNDGNERKPKAQRANRSLETSVLPCPYFKHNPGKYVQRKWKSCAFPGYETIRRLKEHMCRKHLLPEYQCERCHEDLKSVKELEEHSKQMPVKSMRNKNGTRNKTKKEDCNDIYGIAFPHDKNAPSPYVRDSDEDAAGMEINLPQEYRRFLGRELPQLITGELSRIGCPKSDTVRDEVQRYLEALNPQLLALFLDQ
ncbi:hypothetical protein FOXG_21462 [Fusarium oxysporum f. sp. lycopersici 4287]|uniref:C2H2-type domain-containing protein n=1 Tax=Fusarium oxysporum f. sp. lycopersici (strain 4287 / CBS 123668 / FGSC 9935 / NRRL 34936) TaxID=426428 RepID=A0A0J9VY87_FUSO4|nr:hypothetical protein FOXG_21462 [Fusarium oxysporum f. sp. lycopersici 4287]KNB15748.1 hypothetical protein FOXG_21462 [Fusarium oxysporum f. sp. lycopersici 4287]